MLVWYAQSISDYHNRISKLFMLYLGRTFIKIIIIRKWVIRRSGFKSSSGMEITWHKRAHGAGMKCETGYIFLNDYRIERKI